MGFLFDLLACLVLVVVLCKLKNNWFDIKYIYITLMLSVYVDSLESCLCSFLAGYCFYLNSFVLDIS